MQTWFEAKISYHKVTESGKEQKVTEQYLLDAVSYTDAESRIMSLAQEFIKGEFAVKDIKQSNVQEVFPSTIGGGYWYKAKISMVTIDEEAGKEKKLPYYYLIEASDIEEALEALSKSLEFLVIPYEVQSIAKTSICDVFPYDLAGKAAQIN